MDSPYSNPEFAPPGSGAWTLHHALAAQPQPRPAFRKNIFMGAVRIG